MTAPPRRPANIPNAYEDRDRAAAYADLGFAGTHYVSFRDLPDLLARHVAGRRALDFGCGAGRSTRFLKKLGFDAVGIDVAEPMLRIARERDPAGTYLHVRDDAATGWPDGPFDLVLGGWTRWSTSCWSGTLPPSRCPAPSPLADERPRRRGRGVEELSLEPMASAATPGRIRNDDLAASRLYWAVSVYCWKLITIRSRRSGRARRRC